MHPQSPHCKRGRDTGSRDAVKSLQRRGIKAAVAGNSPTQQLLDSAPSTPSILSDPASRDAVKTLQRRGIKATVIVGDPASGAVLSVAELHRADAAVICGLGADDAVSDTQVCGLCLYNGCLWE